RRAEHITRITSRIACRIATHAVDAKATEALRRIHAGIAIFTLAHGARVTCLRHRARVVVLGIDHRNAGALRIAHLAGALARELAADAIHAIWHQTLGVIGARR